MKDCMTGRDAMKLIAEAFGLSPNTSRIVIDLKCDEIARIVRVDLLTREQAAVLVDALKQCNAEVV